MADYTEYLSMYVTQHFELARLNVYKELLKYHQFEILYIHLIKKLYSSYSSQRHHDDPNSSPSLQLVMPLLHLKSNNIGFNGDEVKGEFVEALWNWRDCCQ